MRSLVTLALIPVALTSPALAAQGTTTANVNVRSGPGTNFAAVKTLPAGSTIDILDCDGSGGWCAISSGGGRGFVSGRYLRKNDEPDGWPRSFATARGRMILYQPQFTEWTDFKTIDALVAAELDRGGSTPPVFGVISLKGDTSTDEDAEKIVISNVVVTALNFSGLDRADLAALQLEVGKLLPTEPLSVATARVTTSLADQKRTSDVSGLKADPPTIFTSTTPALLLQTDGEPVFGPVKGKAGLSFLVNTNWDLFRVDAGGALYLRHDTHWLQAAALAGPWTVAATLPELLQTLPQDGDWADARAAIPPEPYPSGQNPKIMVASAASELIIFAGEPALQDIPRTSLRWVSNTDLDVFFDTAGQQWYVLLSGRWFRASSLNGPWTFATPDLPGDFRNLPEDAPYFSVRASVPGTSDNAEARLRASIPTTARVEDGSITPSVAYTGEPQFVPTGATGVSYAANISGIVLAVGGRYYLLQDGVWFVAEQPDGPWQLARQIPDEVYAIPPSSPVYNATYVRVYDTEPGAVWYGYSMGYLFGFLAWGTYVFGTGWSYPPYWYNWAGYTVPVYFPRPATWGIGAYYNPVRGAFGRYGYSYGPYRGIAGVRMWNPATGTYARAGVAWGPRGTAGFVGAYNPQSGRAGYVAGGRNVYGAWKSAGVKQGAEWARLTSRTAGGGSAMSWATGEGRGFVREGRRGDIYAGRDGTVYRNSGGQWQRFDGGWQNVARPDRNELAAAGDGLGAAAGAGAAAAVGAAVNQRVNPGTRQTERNGQATTRREQAGRTPRQSQGEAAQQRAKGQGQARQAPSRSAGKPRPAARAALPNSVMRDAQARALGNQRQLANPAAFRQAPQFSRGPASFAPRGGYSGGRGMGGGGGRGRGGRR
ncbi:MAG: SH3 domain-containing protein [Chelatococcus sp.]|uniref:SH3 domain-containing protein n=1 Tax=Chelatococcus sp. TaxID=1953771 RepID=UPI0025C57948|nr:SH3 domain-containing protein [Chelatococcus sp.]MBX3539820.1 SH3 domain-containing protein [Chelatococcus sp.]